MDQVIVNEIGKITDLLQDVISDAYGLDPQPTIDSVDTLDTAILSCQVLLTRFRRVREWVVEALETKDTREELDHIAWCKEERVDYNGRYSPTYTDGSFPEHNVADLIRWDQITKGVEVPF